MSGYMICKACGYWYDLGRGHACLTASLMAACQAGDATPPQALPPEPPATWAEREDRVAWVLAHFTDGERARLYELLHNAGYRLDGIRARWTTERAGLGG